MRINGEKLDQNFNTTQISLSQFFNVGGGANYYQRMHLCEIAFFTNHIDFEEVEIMEGYLAHKWGKTLVDGHPYKAHPPVG